MFGDCDGYLGNFRAYGFGKGVWFLLVLGSGKVLNKSHCQYVSELDEAR